MWKFLSIYDDKHYYLTIGKYIQELVCLNISILLQFCLRAWSNHPRLAHNNFCNREYLSSSSYTIDNLNHANLSFFQCSHLFSIWMNNDCWNSVYQNNTHQNSID